MYGCESWTMKKAERRRIDAFELWCWRKLLRVFSNESTLHMRWPKYWSFSFSISPSNQHPGLISFKMDWLDLAVQGTLKSLLQHHNSKASILRRSAFFIVQHSHPYLTTGKTIPVWFQILLFGEEMKPAKGTEKEWTFGWKQESEAWWRPGERCVSREEISIY